MFIPIPGYEKLYKIDEYGVVLSFGMVKCKNNHFKSKKEKILSQEMGLGRNKKPNYWRVTIWKDGKKWKPGVHQLVALAFLGPVPNGFTVNHIDGNKLNNFYKNLEYSSRSENQKHAYALGLQKHQYGSDRPLAKLNDKEVLEIINSELTTKQIACKFSISLSLVYMIKAGTRWKHITR
jgi:hypothetical protein